MSLVELVVALVLLAIITGAALLFIQPLRQGVDVTVRADLTDAADNALQRIGREVRLALPNSVRVDGTGQFIEFLPVVVGGRYRAEGYGAGAPTGAPCGATADTDQLLFGAVDDCFKTIGTLTANVAGGQRLVLNNHGPGFPGQDAYEGASPSRNWRTVSTPAADGTHDRIRFDAGTFERALHDSPGKRYFVVSGPVSFSCGAVAGQLTRHAGYPITAAQPTVGPVPPALPAGAVLSGNVSRCQFEYQQNVAPGIGLVTLRLGLSKARSDGGMETIELVHAIHVRNVP